MFLRKARMRKKILSLCSKSHYHTHSPEQRYFTRVSTRVSAPQLLKSRSFHGREAPRNPEARVAAIIVQQNQILIHHNVITFVLFRERTFESRSHKSRVRAGAAWPSPFCAGLSLTPAMLNHGDRAQVALERSAV